MNAHAIIPTIENTHSKGNRADEQVRIAVYKIVRDYHIWQQAIDIAHKQRARLEYHKSIEQLWSLLNEDLCVVAGQLDKGKFDSNMESLVMVMFAQLIRSLPCLDVAKIEDMRAYLMDFVKYGVIEEYRQQLTSASILEQKDLLEVECTGFTKMVQMALVRFVNSLGKVSGISLRDCMRNIGVWIFKRPFISGGNLYLFFTILILVILLRVVIS